VDTEDIEIKMLSESIFLKYGYDFRLYAEASLKRRLKMVMSRTSLASLSALQEKLLHDANFFSEVLSQFTVTTSEMFRDPSFFKALRTQVIPILKTYPAVKIWHAGCSTGEEVYSLAILLKEEGLYERSVIYATDINPVALQTAKDGIYRNESMKTFTVNYQASGGRTSFSDYYTALYGAARFDPSLRANVVFSEHNLAVDEVFSEMHLIICRNVLIYFQRPLQERVIKLFAGSLVYKGFLGLGSKETVRFLNSGTQFSDFNSDERIFQYSVPNRSDLYAGGRQ